jgi:DNA-binding transcriptional LysR family regulator
VDSALFNLRHLKAVIAVAESGTISAAARAVNLTQPAITQAIAKLERQIGMPLFDRTPGAMQPTDAAAILIPRAQAALDLVASPRVTAPQMRAFIAVAAEGSYAAAASATDMREPSLHRAVADLSLRLGQRLVERRGRGIALTPRGAAIARRFRLAQSELRAALIELHALQGREVGRVAVGAMPLSRARLLPAAIAEFRRQRPSVQVAVVEGSYAELVAPLRDGEIEMMVGAMRDPEAVEDLHQEPLFDDHPVVLGRVDHPLTEQVKVDFQMLASFPWAISAPGTPLRQQWRRMFINAGIPEPQVPVECGSVMTIRQLLIESDLLTILSRDQVAAELSNGWLTVICDTPRDFVRHIGLITRRGWRPTATQQDFMDLLRKIASAKGRQGAGDAA